MNIEKIHELEKDIRQRFLAGRMGGHIPEKQIAELESIFLKMIL